MVLLRDLTTVEYVGRVHFQFRDPHEETGPGEGLLVLLVVAYRVADVVAEKALDALAELLGTLDVLLHHPELARLDVAAVERRDLPRLLVVPRNIGDEVADDGKGADRGDRDGLVLGEGGHPGHAHQPGHAVDLRRAGPALAGLAVPPQRQVGGLGGLEAVQDVEDDLALVHLDRVVGQLALALVAAPDLELRLVGHLVSSGSSSAVRYFLSSSLSKSSMRSVRIGSMGWCFSETPPSPDSRQMRLTLRHSAAITGKSSRV